MGARNQMTEPSPFDQAGELVCAWQADARGTSNLVDRIARALAEKDAESDNLARLLAEARRERDSMRDLRDEAIAESSAWAREVERLRQARDAVPRSEVQASQVDRLGRFILEHIPGEPSQSEGAIDTVLRLLGERAAWLATAQEAVELLRAHHEAWERGDDGDALDAPTRAVLARAEVQAWRR